VKVVDSVLFYDGLFLCWDTCRLTVVLHPL